LVYTDIDGLIYQNNIDFTQEKLLSDKKAWESLGYRGQPFAISVSPDGLQVAFGLSQPESEYDSMDIWVMNLEDGRLRQLTDSTDEWGESFPEWSPDGQWILMRHTWMRWNAGIGTAPTVSGGQVATSKVFAVPANANKLDLTPLRADGDGYANNELESSVAKLVRRGSQGRGTGIDALNASLVWLY